MSRVRSGHWCATRPGRLGQRWRGEGEEPPPQLWLRVFSASGGDSYAFRVSISSLTSRTSGGPSEAKQMAVCPAPLSGEGGNDWGQTLSRQAQPRGPRGAEWLWGDGVGSQTWWEGPRPEARPAACPCVGSRGSPDLPTALRVHSGWDWRRGRDRSPCRFLPVGPSWPPRARLTAGERPPSPPLHSGIEENSRCEMAWRWPV